ncbi:MAG TPA: hypothetical protein VE544_05040 [Nitrososphaeraceae archaeon]|nr:hypothetical protein [Nitrososphaeraceae archaeon]
MVERVKNKRTEQLSETVQEVTRPPKDPNKVKSKNVKVTEDCHKRLKEYLYHQRPNWTDVNEVGDVVEVILDEWEEERKQGENGRGF